MFNLKDVLSKLIDSILKLFKTKIEEVTPGDVDITYDEVQTKYDNLKG